MGVDGFSAESALLYHRRPPTAIVKAEAVEEPVAAVELSANRPLLPRHLRTHALPAGGDAITGRRLLLGNDDVRLLVAAPEAGAAGELYRNATGDELVYVESGTAGLESVYGRLEVGPGDYVVIPTSTTHRWVPAPGSRRPGAGGRGPGPHPPAPDATCRRPGSSWSTPPTANATCGGRRSRCWSTRARRRCSSAPGTV